MDNKIYVGDIGTEFVLDSGENLASATVHNILFKKPNGETGTWVGEVAGVTKVSYSVIAEDLDLAGEWELQVYIEMPGWSGRGETAKFILYAVFG